VDVLPNPVVEGDTVTFTCMIADSLDDRFEFTWFIDGESGPIVTSDPTLKWKAELPSGDYIFDVRADNGESERRSVGTSFNVYIRN
jgi:membrane carboxypeptidase/penicillin-binding protein PbpC